MSLRISIDQLAGETLSERKARTGLHYRRRLPGVSPSVLKKLPRVKYCKPNEDPLASGHDAFFSGVARKANPLLKKQKYAAMVDEWYQGWDEAAAFTKRRK